MPNPPSDAGRVDVGFPTFADAFVPAPDAFVPNPPPPDGGVVRPDAAQPPPGGDAGQPNVQTNVADVAGSAVAHLGRASPDLTFTLAFDNRGPGAETLDIETLSFDLRLRTLKLAGVAVELTQKDYDLALFLVQHIGRLLSRGHIQQSVWGNAVEIPSRTIDTHVSRIRSKLNLRPEGGFKLTPIYNYGYRLERLQPSAA